MVNVFEAVPAAILIAEGGAHPGAGELGGAGMGGCSGGEGGSLMGVVEDLEEVLGDGGANVVVCRGVHDGLHLGSREEKVNSYDFSLLKFF